MAAKGSVEVKGVTDHDWRALECVRANGTDWTKEIDCRKRTLGGGWQEVSKRLEPKRSAQLKKHNCQRSSLL